MIKICQWCGKEYQPTGRYQKYCPDCKHNAQLAYNKQWRTDNAEQCKAYRKQWYVNNTEYKKACSKQYRDKKRQLKKLEAKKLRLIAKLQVTAAKRQAEQTRRKELYQGDSFWDNNLNAFAQRM